MGRIGHAAVIATLIFVGCSADSRPPRTDWTGTVDTMPSGHVVVRNDDRPLWRSGAEWSVEEVLRIGSVEGGGPDAFGRIEAFEVDREGRIWVLERRTQQLIVFDTAGNHVRTIGRRGGGPGEFMEPVAVHLAPDGRLWVVDVGTHRISVLDTAGNYVDGMRIPVLFRMIPWLGGGFDDVGRYYAPVWAPRDPWEQFAITLVRHDSDLVPRDTLERPRDPIRREVYEYPGTPNYPGGIGIIPFQGDLAWQRTRRGTVLALLTDEYRLFELGWSGDTLRTITRRATPLPVTDADLEQLRRDFAREIEEQGALPRWWSRIPRTKPPVTGFFFEDDEGNIWVELEPVDVTASTRTFDVFDPDGRYLGPVHVPFVLRGLPAPIVRDGFLYGVTFDELDVPYIVKARIVRPAIG